MEELRRVLESARQYDGRSFFGEATSSSLQNKECENSIRSDGDVASPHTTVAERLVLLEELKVKGLVTPEEYATQRQRILSEI